jgi:hypothetical protein
MWDQVSQLHAYHGNVPVEIRLLKLTEEVGEVAEAFLGVHGLNKRKGVCRLVRKRREITGTFRTMRTRDRATPLPSRAGRFPGTR